jgi:hypothetical protein
VIGHERVHTLQRVSFCAYDVPQEESGEKIEKVRINDLSCVVVRIAA